MGIAVSDSDETVHDSTVGRIVFIITRNLTHRGDSAAAIHIAIHRAAADVDVGVAEHLARFAVITVIAATVVGRTGDGIGTLTAAKHGATECIGTCTVLVLVDFVRRGSEVANRNTFILACVNRIGTHAEQRVTTDDATADVDLGAAHDTAVFTAAEHETCNLGAVTDVDNHTVAEGQAVEVGAVLACQTAACTVHPAFVEA